MLRKLMDLFGEVLAAGQQGLEMLADQQLAHPATQGREGVSPAAQVLPALCQRLALLARQATPSGAAQAAAQVETATLRLTAVLVALAV